MRKIVDWLKDTMNKVHFKIEKYNVFTSPFSTGREGLGVSNYK